MFYYVEYLRGLRALRVIGIILGVLLIIAIALRLWAFSLHSPEDLAARLQSSPTAHTTTQTIFGGTRTVIDDPAQRVHAVVLKTGGSYQINAVMPIAQVHRGGHMIAGNYNWDENQKTGMAHVVASSDKSADIGIGILFAIGAIIGLITATMLGGVLAKENDGHLELAWTKPVSRERLALGSIAADIVTIVSSQLLAVIVMLLIIVMFVRPSLFANSQTLPLLACALLGPIAWYACLTAFSASMTRGLGLVCGLGWLAAIGIPAIAQGTSFAIFTSNPVWNAIHWIFEGLAYIDPIAYISFHGMLLHGSIAFHTFVGSVETSVLGLFLLAIGYIALAVAQWRRVEA